MTTWYLRDSNTDGIAERVTNDTINALDYQICLSSCTPTSAAETAPPDIGL